MEDIPLIGWLLIFLTVFIGSISLIVKTRRIGKEQYDLNFFKSWSFLIILVTTVCFYLVFSVFSLVLFANDESASEILQADVIRENLYWGAGSVAVGFLMAAFMNIRKSTLFFGLVYTIGQSIAVLFSVLLIFLLFMRVSKASDSGFTG